MRRALASPALSSLLLLLGACHGPTSSAAPPEQPFIVDANGGAVILRGVNVMNATKSDPSRLAPIGPADAVRIANDWGMNFARLLILWDALEPSEGTIDSAYLDGVASRVDLLSAQGIFVMLDMHQDVYSAAFCCDGAPTWAIADDDASFTLQSSWGLNYLQPAVVSAFDNFWGIHPGHPNLASDYVQAWQAVASRFHGYPGVLGYDLINEPFPGSDFDALEALARVEPDDGGTSKIFDQTVLGPFYQRVIDAIRDVDDSAYIFFEPRYAAPANGSPSYLGPLNDPRAAGGPRLVYAPHLYSSSVAVQNAYDPSDPTVADWQAARMTELAAAPVPLLVGEWGTEFDMDGGAAYAEDILDMADQMRASWAYWSYDPSAAGGWGLFDPTTLADNPATSIVVRPYPRRIAGYPTSWSFDRASATFDLVWESRSGVSGTTDVFVAAEKQYPGGWAATLDGVALSPDSSAWNAATGVLSITAPSKGSHHLQITALDGGRVTSSAPLDATVAAARPTPSSGARD